MSPTTYVVTGANRGIGFGLVKSLAQRENVLIYATARDPSKATELNALAETANGRVVVVQLEATSEKDAQAAAELVRRTSGKLDYLIANAGMANLEAIIPAIETTPAMVDEHFAINTLGPLLIFRALAPLLFAGPTPHFIAISSALGSLSLALPFPLTAYGVSKAALNYLVVKLAADHGKKDRLAAYAISPGFTQTDMGSACARQMGLEDAPTRFEDSLRGCLALIDGATVEKTGGRFWDYTGEELTW